MDEGRGGGARLISFLFDLFSCFFRRELLRHTDVRFNNNGTMTYVATRTAVFLPEMTVDIRLDDKLILPNFAALVRTLDRLPLHSQGSLQYDP